MEIVKIDLPTRNGAFTGVAFRNSSSEAFALVKGWPVEGAENLLVRVHSGCLEGDVFSSQLCDCREQLEKALGLISKEKQGILIYLDQEGRGIGLFNKMKALALQEKGLDTHDANIQLGFPADSRDYADAAAILKTLGVKSIRLLTNNPNKPKQLEKTGVKVSEVVPLKTAPNKFNEKYLQTKKTKLGHQL